MGERWGEGERLLNFLAFRMGAYSRWALIRGWALIRINTVNIENMHMMGRTSGLGLQGLAS